MVAKTINEANKKFFRSSHSLDREGFEFVLSQLDQDMIDFLERLRTMDDDLVDLETSGPHIDIEKLAEIIAKLCHIDKDEIFQFIDENPGITNREFYEIMIQKSGLSDFEFFKQLMIENHDEEGLENLAFCEQLAKECNIDIDEILDIFLDPNLSKEQTIAEIAKRANMSEYELIKRFSTDYKDRKVLQGIEETAQMFGMSVDELVKEFRDHSDLDPDDFAEYLLQKSGLTEEDLANQLEEIIDNNEELFLDMEDEQEQYGKLDEDFESLLSEYLMEVAETYDLTMDELFEELESNEEFAYMVSDGILDQLEDLIDNNEELCLDMEDEQEQHGKLDDDFELRVGEYLMEIAETCCLTIDELFEELENDEEFADWVSDGMIGLFEELKSK